MLTRCPACSTVFRLDTVQLRAREGRVRCGRCHAVFDAVDAMVELPLPRTVPAPAPTLPGDLPVAADPPPPPAPAGENGGIENSQATLNIVNAMDIEPPAAEPAAIFTDRLQDEGAAPVPTPRTGESVDALVERSVGHFERNQVTASPRPPAAGPDDDGLTADDAPPSGPVTSGPTDTVPADTTDTPPAPGAVAPLAAPDPLLDPPPPLEPVDDPAVQRIRRELYGDDGKRPRSVLATSLWALGCMLLLLLATGQLAYMFRTELAVAQPLLKPLLEEACTHIGCTVPAPRRAAQISIESSELNPDPDRAPQLRLNALLRNGAAFAQDWPHLELTLTDTGDRAVVRRVLAPTDYLPAGHRESHPLFAARSEQAIALMVDPTDTGAGGYRLYAFYP